MDLSRCAAESALRSRTASRRSSFFLTPTSVGLREELKMKYGMVEYDYELLPEFYSSHFDKILSNFSDALLAFVDRKVGPVYQLIIDLYCVVMG
jgi:hypothetical protein